MPSVTTTDAIRLDYTVSGPADGRPIVLLAGFKAAATTWLFQVPALVAAGYRVFAVDLRGHGASDRPPGQTMARRGEDVNDFLTALDLTGVVLVGQSMGGNTIWAYSELFGQARLAGIVIVDQTPQMLATPDWPHGYYGFDESNVDTFFTAGIPPTGHGTPLWRRGARLLRLVKAVRSSPSESRELTPIELELLADHAHKNWRPQIALAEVPVLFVAAAESELWPSAHAAAAAALSPLAVSAVIPNDGHAANIEQPKQFNRLLLEFVARLH